MLAVGLNHKTAPIAIREQAAFSPEKAAEALSQLVALPAVNEALILSTCNRTELYCDGTDQQGVTQWLADYTQLPVDDMNKYWYAHSDQAAVDHLMKVACGLDSMMLGESQIISQLKDAYSLAQEKGAVGQAFSRLFPTVFSITKQVRSDTSIGASPVSIAYAATKLAKQIFKNLSEKSVLLIGAGDTIELAAMHFHNQGVQRIVVANRSLERAKQLADKYQGHYISLADLPVYLKESDIVVAATASPLPILGKGAVESALKVRKHRPIFMLDLAVPRDIEPEVAELEDVYLYNIDDLKGIVAQNKESREEAASLASEMIHIHASHFMREWQSLDSLRTVRSYREKVEDYKEDVLQMSLQQLKSGAPPENVLTELAHNLANKIMHHPTLGLRQAAFDGRHDLLSYAKKLFRLEDK